MNHWSVSALPQMGDGLGRISICEPGKHPLKTWLTAIKFVPVIPALAQCLLNSLSKKTATSIDHSLVQMVILAQRNAGKAAIAADLQSFSLAY